MSNFLLSPNMNLPIPVPGVDPGPDYANNLNSSLTIVDGHDHSPGSGNLITPLGLNINSNLNIQNNQLSNVGSILFSMPQADTVPLTLYTNAQSGGGITDLFFNDGAGNIIPITKGGIVNSVAASIPGESYSAGTFTWVQGSGSTTPANFDIGFITLRPNTPSTTFGITLQPPVGISSQYNLFLPALPPGQQIMTLDASGNISAPYTVDNSSIIISSNVIQIGALPANSVTTSSIANGAVTQAKLAPRSYTGTAPAGGIAAAGIGTYGNSSTTPVTVPGSTITITTTGRPVMVFLSPQLNNSASYIATTNSATTDTEGVVNLGNITTGNGAVMLMGGFGVAGNPNIFLSPPSAFQWLDTSVNGLPGTYTYQLGVHVTDANTTISVINLLMTAYEI